MENLTLRPPTFELRSWSGPCAQSCSTAFEYGSASLRNQHVRWEVHMTAVYRLALEFMLAAAHSCPKTPATLPAAISLSITQPPRPARARIPTWQGDCLGCPQCVRDVKGYNDRRKTALARELTG